MAWAVAMSNIRAVRRAARSSASGTTLSMHYSDTAYTRTAIGLHWIIFVTIAAGWALGQYMTGLPFFAAEVALRRVAQVDRRNCVPAHCIASCVARFPCASSAAGEHDCVRAARGHFDARTPLCSRRRYSAERLAFQFGSGRADGLPRPRSAA